MVTSVDAGDPPAAAVGTGPSCWKPRPTTTSTEVPLRESPKSLAPGICEAVSNAWSRPSGPWWTTADWVTYQDSGALLMPPTVNLRLPRPAATWAATPSRPVAFMTLTVNEPRAGAGTTTGLQVGFEAAGVIQPAEYAAVMLAVPSRTPGMVTKSMTWRMRCLRHSCLGVR